MVIDLHIHDSAVGGQRELSTSSCAAAQLLLSELYSRFDHHTTPHVSLRLRTSIRRSSHRIRPWYDGWCRTAMMNIPTRALATCTPAATTFLSPAFSLRPLLLQRRYASQTGLGTTSQGPKRKTVTPFNDDGHVPWSELSGTEKAARATQQTFNLGLILVGTVLTVRL